VLVVACSNVASMMLARAASRKKEVAIRLAMGAGRARVIRQTLVESAALFTFGGAMGLLIALAANRLLLSFIPAPLYLDSTLDWRVICFGLATGLIAGLLFGISPALQSPRTDLLTLLKGDKTGATGTMRARNAFVVAQIAISLVLLVGGALFLRSLNNASKIDPGLNPDGVLTAEFNVGIGGYDEPKGRLFYRQLTEGLRATPSVLGVGLARIVPLSGDVTRTGVKINPESRDHLDVDDDVVSAGYFQVVQTPILAGREFYASDSQNSPRVAVVNETFARRFFPGSDAIGKQFMVEKRSLQIVGIAKDGKYNTPGETAKPFFYECSEQHYSPKVTLLIRTSAGSIPSVIAAYREQIRAMDKNLPVPTVVPMSDKIGFSLIPLRVAASVAGVLGALGLFLASVGLFGLVSYSVAQRTPEIGVRMALGASRSAVVLMIVLQGLKLVAAGVAIGLGLSFFLTQALKGLLYGIGAADPPSFFGMAGLLVLVATVASLIPAMRGSKVDPVTALRYE
ncbi:MAG TPA: FtsX-like permease family protein, partial [Blastocatellia bacterium]